MPSAIAQLEKARELNPRAPEVALETLPSTIHEESEAKYGVGPCVSCRSNLPCSRAS